MDEKELGVILLDDNEYNPYDLRKRGLDEPLTMFQFGRALYHLNQRRGFRSNRKTLLAAALKHLPELKGLADRDDQLDAASARRPRKANNDELDEATTKLAISELQSEITASHCRTVGEYLWSVKCEKAVRPSTLSSLVPSKVRGLYTARTMYEEEFDKLWFSQARFHSEILTDALKVKVASAIFFQRPLSVQKELIGNCPFEFHRKRAAKACLEFQRFRILQQLNDLEVKHTLTRIYRPLSGDERSRLVDLLESKEKPTMKQLRKCIGLHDGEIFNFEDGGREDLIGNRTAHRMREIIGSDWDVFGAETQQQLLQDMLTIHRKEDLVRRLSNHWVFDSERVYKLALAELEPGYASLSLKAIRKLLPLLELGIPYATACKQIGYQGGGPRGYLQKLPDPPLVRNPAVQRSLSESRRVINEVIRVYGKPSIVRIELARDMKLSKKQKEAREKQNRINLRLNEEAAEKIRQCTGIENPTAIDKLKYRLWVETKHVCPYTGQSISLQMLFGESSEVDIDHIIPYSRCLDDSYMNKTICLATVNRSEKRERTPYEAYAANQDRYQEILGRVSHLTQMPFSKRRKFELREINTDECISRQLNDTRYICKEVHNYLQLLGCDVSVTKGEATHALRHKWSLNKILAADGSNQKNRFDHRHHAIDAIVTALTGVSLFQLLSRLSSQSGLALRDRRLDLPDPWPDFFRTVERKIEMVIVSHAARHKLRDALHEATAYGPSDKDGVYVARYPLSSLKPAQIEDIRDPVVRELICQRMSKHGNSAELAFAEPLYHVNGIIPINKVRLNKRLDPQLLLHCKDKLGREFKHYKFGNNHHAEIVEHLDTGKWEIVIINTLESAARARRSKKPIVNYDHGLHKRLLFPIFQNDLLQLTINGETSIYRIKSLENSSDQKRLCLAHHTSADPGEKPLRLVASRLQSYDPKKVTVDRLGQIQYATGGKPKS